VVTTEIAAGLKAVLTLRHLPAEAAATQMKKLQRAANFIDGGLNEPALYTLLSWVFIGQLGKAKTKADPELLSQAWAEEWQLYKTLTSTLVQMELPESEISNALKALRLITSQQDWYVQMGKKPFPEIAKTWFSNPEIQSFLQVNRFEDILWYNRECFADFLWWMALVALICCEMQPQFSRNDVAETLLGSYEILQSLIKADKVSDSQVEKLLDGLIGTL